MKEAPKSFEEPQVMTYSREELVIEAVFTVPAQYQD